MLAEIFLSAYKKIVLAPVQFSPAWLIKLDVAEDPGNAVLGATELLEINPCRCDSRVRKQTADLRQIENRGHSMIQGVPWYCSLAASSAHRNAARVGARTQDFTSDESAVIP